MKRTRSLRHRRDCRKHSGALAKALDGGQVELGLRRHLRNCVSCKRLLSEQRRLSTLLRSLAPTIPAPPRVSRTARMTRRVMSGAGGLGIAGFATFLVRQIRKRP